jgi:hypothetical protein
MPKAAEDQEDEFDITVTDENGVEIEVEDDTPPEDRDREPMPKELVDEIEADELEDYSDAVKKRLKQMRKLQHDERRAKEQAEREKNEAISFAQKMIDDNKALRSTLSKGETTLITSFKETAEAELAAARKAYKEAYEAGDSDKLLEAQEKLNEASYRLNNLKSYRPALQEEETEVREEPVASVPKPDAKTVAWQERNSWWGTDPEMTATALGFHQKLEREKGAAFVGTDEYWKAVDNTMRRRYPEYFTVEKPAANGRRPATVVAPASRSTGPKRVVLTKTQAALAKKFGLTLEQYAEAQLKLENRS